MSISKNEMYYSLKEASNLMKVKVPALKARCQFKILMKKLKGRLIISHDNLMKYVSDRALLSPSRGLRGIYFKTKRRSYQIRVKFSGKHIHIGYTKISMAGYMAYDLFLRTMNGQVKTALNFPSMTLEKLKEALEALDTVAFKSTLRAIGRNRDLESKDKEMTFHSLNELNRYEYLNNCNYYEVYDLTEKVV